MIGITTTDTCHGNPGESRMLHKGTKVKLIPASNLPSDSEIKYWASPLRGHPWPYDIKQWSEDVGVGLHKDDVVLL